MAEGSGEDLLSVEHPDRHNTIDRIMGVRDFFFHQFTPSYTPISTGKRRLHAPVPVHNIDVNNGELYVQLTVII